MPLVIPDDALRAAGMDEREAKVEIACRWFDEGKLAIGHATRLTLDVLKTEIPKLQAKGYEFVRASDVIH